MTTLPLTFQQRPRGEDAPLTQTLPGALGRAMSRGDLHLHYQPQYTVGGVLTGFEALLRLDAPLHPGVRPEHLVALAEDGGYIAPLGRWALRQAAVQLAMWRAEGLTTRVAVNVSPAQLARQDFTAVVEAVLDEYGLPGEALELEVTERLPLHDLALTRAHFTRLAGRGVELALDDFRFEPSRWRLLRKLPFSSVKLDRSVVGRWHRGRWPSPTLRGLLPWLRRRGVGVVAEGVETAAQLEAARRLGCERVQGYWFAPALSAWQARGLLLDTAPAGVAR